jgi:hypothetical protein
MRSAPRFTWEASENGAAKGQVDRIKVDTINPDAEEKAASQERQARLHIGS